MLATLIISALLGGATFVWFRVARTTATQASGSSAPAEIAIPQPNTGAATPASPAPVDVSVAQLFVCSSEIGVLAHAILNLSESPTTSVLRVHPRGMERCLGVAPRTDIETTRALIAALGSAGTLPRWDVASVWTPLRVTVDRWTLLRATAEQRSDPVMQMPRGTVGIAFVGTIEGHESAVDPGNARAWAFVATSDRIVGWISGRALGRSEGCLPAIDALHSIASSGLTTDGFLLGTTTIRRANQRVAGVWLIERVESAAESHVTVFSLSDACTPERVHQTIVSGWVADMQIVDATASGGPTLVVLGAHMGPVMDPFGREMWRVTELGATTPAFERTIATGSAAGITNRIDIETGVRRRPDGATGYWPMRLKPSSGPEEFFSWSAGALTSESVGGVEFGEWHY